MEPTTSGPQTFAGASNFEIGGHPIFNNASVINIITYTTSGDNGKVPEDNTSDPSGEVNSLSLSTVPAGISTPNYFQ